MLGVSEQADKERARLTPRRTATAFLKPHLYLLKPD
jgi:hypothetical protein